MERTFRYRLFPTSKQSSNLRTMLADHCDLYNAALQERRDAYRGNGVTVRYGDQSAQLRAIRLFDPDIARWSFTSEQQTLRRLDRAFQAFFRRIKFGQTPGYPRFRGKRWFDTVSFIDGDGGKFLGDRVKMQGIGHVKVKLHRPIRGTVKQFSVTRVGQHWYLNVTCVEVPQQIRPLTGATIGLDRGVTSLIADSDGGFAENPRHLGKSAERLVSAQRDLARKKRGSARRQKAVQRVAGIHRKIGNQRQDRLHKVSRRLVDTYDLIVMEDLKIGNMTRSASGTIGSPGTNVAQKSGLNRSILDAGWGVLQNMVRYKAESAGVEMVLVDPRNTSRTCHSCGHVSADNRSREVFLCTACGHSDHADTNAARNILGLGLSLRSAAPAA